MKRFMIFNAKKFNIMLSLLLVTTLSLGINNKAEILPISNQIKQEKDVKKFIFTPQTIVKTNLPKQAPSLFELQRILRERFGQSAIIGGFRAKGKSVIELWTDSEMGGKEHHILDILDRILQSDVCNTANKRIAPVRIDAASATVIQP